MLEAKKSIVSSTDYTVLAAPAIPRDVNYHRTMKSFRHDKKRTAGSTGLLGAALPLAVAALASCAGSVRPEAEETPRAEPRPDGPERRAVAYLSEEVSRWHRENACYSCHNNADAARALMTAESRSFAVEDGALAGTLAFIATPALWDANSKGDPAASDLDLARVQFAAALVTASELGYVRDPEAISRAARLVAEVQSPGGAWNLGPPDLVGSPATYGRFLGTHMALRVLRHADADDLRGRVERAEAWMRENRARNLLDAAALLMELGRAADARAVAQRESCLDLIRRGQAASGGWGPYASAPPEVFDTAVILIALARLEATPELTERIARGRAFLLSAQEPGGGWPETTRPSGSESYAQHISTTAWAALALLATGGRG